MPDQRCPKEMVVVVGILSITATVGAVLANNDVNDKPISPLLHVLRSQRFDFNMFGCGLCRPGIECTSDIYCHYKYGRQYSCQETCCTRSIRCVVGGRSDDDDPNTPDEADPISDDINLNETLVASGRDDDSDLSDDDDDEYYYDGLFSDILVNILDDVTQETVAPEYVNDGLTTDTVTSVQPDTTDSMPTSNVHQEGRILKDGIGQITTMVNKIESHKEAFAKPMVKLG